MTSLVNRSDRSRLARAIELNDGFQLCFVFGPVAAAQDLVATAVADAARACAEPVNLLWFLPQDDAVHQSEEAQHGRVVWVLDGDDGNLDLSERLRSLNTRRETMSRHRRTSLVVLLRTRSYSAVARAAPDLWSIRTLALSADLPLEEDFKELDEWRASCEAAFAKRLEEQPIYRERYEHGRYTFTYRIDPTKRPLSLREFHDLMKKIGGWTGWRPWWVPSQKLAPYSVNTDLLECWMVTQDSAFPDPAHSDFWRASPDGSFFLLRGYDEDSIDKFVQGERFSISLPIWRAGEALFHALQVAKEIFDGFAPIQFAATWSGLRGRTATEWPNRTTGAVGESISRQDSISSAIIASIDELEDELTSVIKRLLQPLYDAFLVNPSEGFIHRNIQDVRGHPVWS
ncbi:MAG: hypothetical protein AAGF11_25285 [Myxococcota bacterium]